jgi:hypothetical protein
MKITTVGIDLAKNVFQIHGVDQRDKVVVRKRLRRHQVLTYFAQLTPCLVGMEACGGAHYWARKLQAQGHTVKLMAPQFVKPYVNSRCAFQRNGEPLPTVDSELLRHVEQTLNASGVFRPIDRVNALSMLTGASVLNVVWSARLI